jgi:hypothetical protein
MKEATMAENQLAYKPIKRHPWQLASIVWAALLVFSPQPSSAAASPAANIVIIYDTSGTTQTDRPVSLARPTRKGDIANCYQASIAGTQLLTQTDVKNRWPDGSVKFAVVSFVIPTLPATGSVTISFSNRTTCNNAGFLTQAQMLDAAYDFDAMIEMQGAKTETVSARQMLLDNHFTYWLQGPVVTAVTIETKTPAREYDRNVDGGSGNPLHPIFDVWFYPQNKTVDIGYTVENVWASSEVSKSMRDQTYSLTLKSGQTTPTTEFTHSTFTQIGKTTVHKRSWLGPSDPGKIRVDHYLPYLVQTGLIPPYDIANQVSETTIANEYSNWLAAPKNIDGNGTETGNYPGDNGRTTTAGASPWIWMDDWHALYLRTMDDRMLEQTMGNADLAGRIPIYIREADTLAGSGDYFDKDRSVDTFGKVFSIFARPSNGLRDLNFGAATADQYNLGSITPGAGTGPTHQPRLGHLYLLSGDPYYLRQAQYNGAFVVGFRPGICTQDYPRCGATVPSFPTEAESRGLGHSFDITAFAATVSPDGSPEQAYFDEMMKRGIAALEGILNLPNSYPENQAAWDHGRTILSKQPYHLGDFTSTSPLGAPRRGLGAYASEFAGSNPGVLEADAAWGWGFYVNALGNARMQKGYQVNHLLQFISRIYLNLMGNPAITNRYLSEAYVWPTVVTDPRWVASWQEFQNVSTNPPTSCFAMGGGSHSYRLIFGGALSRLYEFSADGLTGAQAWNAFTTMCPTADQSQYSTGGAKWAIIPFTLAGGSVPPPPTDTTPPAPPTGLRVQ